MPTTLLLGSANYLTARRLDISFSYTLGISWRITIRSPGLADFIYAFVPLLIFAYFALLLVVL